MCNFWNGRWRPIMFFNSTIPLGQGKRQIDLLHCLFDINFELELWKLTILFSSLSLFMCQTSALLDTFIYNAQHILVNATFRFGVHPYICLCMWINIQTGNSIRTSVIYIIICTCMHYQVYDWLMDIVID